MTTNQDNNSDNDPAVNLIRSRIAKLYGDKTDSELIEDAIETPKNTVKPKDVPIIEPNIKTQINTVSQATTELSKHQVYMKQLNESGKPLPEIQTEWHNYYQKLSDLEKYQVWQEFYTSNQPKPSDTYFTKPVVIKEPKISQQPQPKVMIYDEPKVKPKLKKTKKTIADAKDKIHSSLSKNQRAKLSAKEHFKSLLFGLSLGAVVMIILLFSFFNERFIAPFITPSKTVSSTPIIIDPNSTTAGPENLVIIPKINVEVPVVYNVASDDEKDIQKGLEDGVVHYVSTPSPGEQGNSVIVGHSSNNIFNSGKYKFAFVLLNKLEIGDTFSMTKNSKRYVYKVYKKDIVKPTDISVLGKTEKSSTVTLITCDPPGTSINRLIIVGEQISPDPAVNLASTAKTVATQPTIVPGNSPTLWSRLKSWLFS